MPKNIAIYGSTGSIGTQALDVVDAHPNLFNLVALSAHSNIDLFIEQCLKYKPKHAIIVNEAKYDELKEALAAEDIEVHTGEQSLIDLAKDADFEMLIAAIVGFAGMSSTLAAIQSGKKIGLANKETLVVAGELVMEAVQANNTELIPIDSEHSAIFQCLVGEQMDELSKIILTASGGPFRGKKPNFLANVKKHHALQHPNWTMGAKITIDSASLMNKGLEMIEAKWLFGLQNDQIEVLVHPESIIHSLVEFIDGSQKAQLGLPDMKLPIQYAMAYPMRIKNDFPRMSLMKIEKLNFEGPDLKTFRNLAIAMEAMAKGGNCPAVMNAANEVVVKAFLENKIGFLEMSDLIEKSIEKIEFIQQPTLDEYFETDKKTRAFCSSLFK